MEFSGWRVLKNKFFILPIVALALGASWLGNERRFTSLVEKRSSALKEALAARASGSGADAVGSKAKSADQLAQEKGPTDWKKLAAQMMERESSGSLRNHLRIKEKFSALSKEELASALDEIATVEMPEEVRAKLQHLLLDLLCGQDPEFALTRHFGLADDQNSWTHHRLVEALASWAGKNPAAATAWLDQQIAAGKFDSKFLDGKNPTWMRFEAALIMALNSTDPAAAVARLKSLPEDQRTYSLAGYSIDDKDQLAYANLVRNGLTEEAQAEVFGWRIQNMVSREGGYIKVTEYLNRIQVTPGERVIYVQKAAACKIDDLSQEKKLTREDIDAMRDWTTSQAPGTTDKVTGFALGYSTGPGRMEFPKAAALATQYHEASGNDEVLIGFLMACAPEDSFKEDARVLAAKISDVKRREEILNRFK